MVLLLTNGSIIFQTKEMLVSCTLCMTRNQLAINDKYISVCKKAVESWRIELKVAQSEKLLVTFAGCHDEELRYYKMFPEFLSCDVTFGVTKKRMNLFLMAGIDANNKVFTCFHSFMPSKQARAYHWALRVALRNFLTDKYC